MSDTPMITGLFHAVLKTNDLPASLAFYTQLLGLRQAVRRDTGHSGAWLTVPLAGRPSILHIHADGPILGLTDATRLQPGRGFFDAVSYPKLAKPAQRPPHEAD